jgi:hypothetical protein
MVSPEALEPPTIFLEDALPNFPIRLASPYPISLLSKLGHQRIQSEGKFAFCALNAGQVGAGEALLLIGCCLNSFIGLLPNRVYSGMWIDSEWTGTGSRIIRSLNQLRALDAR